MTRTDLVLADVHRRPSSSGTARARRRDRAPGTEIRAGGRDDPCRRRSRSARSPSLRAVRARPRGCMSIILPLIRPWLRTITCVAVACSVSSADDMPQRRRHGGASARAARPSTCSVSRSRGDLPVLRPRLRDVAIVGQRLQHARSPGAPVPRTRSSTRSRVRDVDLARPPRVARTVRRRCRRAAACGRRARADRSARRRR